MGRLSYELATAMLLIDAGLAYDPEEGPPEGTICHPVYAGGYGANGEPRVNVKDMGTDDEPRNHAGLQLSRPIVEIQIHTTTRAEAWRQGMLLQQFCDVVGERTATRGDDSLVVTSIARTSGVKQMGEHPKTKLYITGVTVILSVSTVIP